MFILCTSKQHATKLVNFLNFHETECGGYYITTDKAIPDYWFWNCSIGVCYGYPWLIDKKTHVDAKGIGRNIPFYNFHPAPLPTYGDWGNYSRGLSDLKSGKLKQWGVSLHLTDENIDKGTVLRVIDIPLISIPDDMQELGDIGHYYMFQLFKQTIGALRRWIPKTKEELDRLC